LQRILREYITNNARREGIGNENWSVTQRSMKKEDDNEQRVEGDICA